MSRHLFILLVLALALAFYPGAVYAASLSVVPDASTIAKGDTFGATVYLDSAGGSINASDGTLSFSPNILEAESVAYGTSIFTMWAQEPSIDNTNGSISWSGGSSTAFSGSHGRVLRVIFLAKKSGTVILALPSSSIYADDGLGTNVVTAPTISSVTVVNAPTVTPSPATSPAPSGDEKIVVSSPTNPSQDEWYASTTAVLLLKVPAEADSVRTILDANASAIPIVTYRPPIDQKNLDTLTDGIWYFNIRGHYTDGWGPITLYRLQIDTVPPMFSALSAFYDATSSALSVFASASDATSGIRDYALVVDEEVVTNFKPADVANGSYRMPVNLKEGTHAAQIRAFDNAGNETSSKIFNFTVPPSVKKQNLIVSWIGSFSSGDWILFISLLLTFFSIGMNIILWTRLRFHEHRLVRGIDMRKIRSLTVSQLAVFRKEVANEIHILERAHQRRDITIEEDDEIKQMHQHLIELEAFIEKQIEAIEK